jgi:hypothetical protein
MTTQTWTKGFHVGPMKFRVTLMKHTYAPKDKRWVLQTSTFFDFRI